MNFLINNDNRIVGTTEHNNLDEFPEYMRKEYKLLSPTEFFKDCTDDETKVEKMLQSANMHHEHWFDSNGKCIIEIQWGDWSRDHIFCRNLMKVLGYIGSESITEEDGSDTYSSIHTYTKGVFT